MQRNRLQVSALPSILRYYQLDEKTYILKHFLDRQHIKAALVQRFLLSFSQIPYKLMIPQCPQQKKSEIKGKFRNAAAFLNDTFLHIQSYTHFSIHSVNIFPCCISHALIAFACVMINTKLSRQFVLSII